MNETPSMYRLVMGEAFFRLDPPVRQFHSCAGRHGFQGEVQVGAPASIPAKWLAFALGVPQKASEGPMRFELQADPQTETWTRFFPTITMRSTLTREGSRIVERLGATRLTFELLEVGGALVMRLVKLHFLGIPCPSWLMPSVMARERGATDRFHFQVLASVPGIGVVASYVGHLEMLVEEGS